MSESCHGGEPEFVRLWLPGSGVWVAHYRANGPGFDCTLVGERKDAEIFVSPSAAMLKNIAGKLGAVEPLPATFAEWIEADRERDQGTKGPKDQGTA